MSKNKFKSLYEFTVPKLVEAEEVTLSHDDTGNELKTVKKVKKETPQKFHIKRPNRGEYDEAELYYNKKVGEGLSSGLISNALLAKRIDGDGGLISAMDKEALVKLQQQLADKKAELESLDKEAINYSTLKEEVDKLQATFTSAAQNYNQLENSIFQVTAENWARNKITRWWLLRLLYNEDHSPFFVGSDDTEKLEYFYDLEDTEGDERAFLDKVMYQAMLAVAYWRANGKIDAEDLKKLAESED